MEKCTYNAQEIATLLGISVSKAYELLHCNSFPTLRIGKRLLVSKERFAQWMEAQSNSLVDR